MIKDNPICPVCTSWMEEKGEWLVCLGCKFQKKSVKKKVTPLPKKLWAVYTSNSSNGTGDVSDFNAY